MLFFFLVLLTLVAGNCAFSKLTFQVDGAIVLADDTMKPWSCRGELFGAGRGQNYWMPADSVEEKKCGKIASKFYECPSDLECKAGGSWSPETLECNKLALTPLVQKPMTDCKTTGGKPCLNQFYHAAKDGKVYKIAGGCTKKDYGTANWCGTEGGATAPVQNDQQKDSTWGDCDPACPAATETVYTGVSVQMMIAEKTPVNRGRNIFVGSGVVAASFVLMTFLISYRYCNKRSDEYHALIDDQAEI